MNAVKNVDIFIKSKYLTLWLDIITVMFYSKSWEFKITCQNSFLS